MWGGGSGMWEACVTSNSSVGVCMCITHCYSLCRRDHAWHMRGQISPVHGEVPGASCIHRARESRHRYSG